MWSESRAPSQEATRSLPGLLAVEDRRPAVDDHVVDAERMAGRLHVGRVVGDGRRDRTRRGRRRPPRAGSPRSRRPRRAAGTDVSFATAVSSDNVPRSRTYVPSTRAVEPYVRGCGRPASRIGMPGPASLRVGADRDPGHGHDRLDVGLGHAVDDDRDVEAIVHQRIEREVGRLRAEVLAELGERPAGPVRMAGGMRDADAGPARDRRRRSPSPSCPGRSPPGPGPGPPGPRGRPRIPRRRGRAGPAAG